MKTLVQPELPGVSVPWSLPPRFRTILKNALVCGDAAQISELCEVRLEIAQDACEMWYAEICRFLQEFGRNSPPATFFRKNYELSRVERQIMDSLIWQKQKHG